MLNSYTTMANLSQNMAKIMSERGINQVELAKKSGIAQPLLSSYLNESARAKYPSLPNLLSLARALNCTLEELTGLESLHDAEKRIPELTPDALKFGKFYETLPDGDPLKEYLRKMIEQKSDSSETDKENDSNPK